MKNKNSIDLNLGYGNLKSFFNTYSPNIRIRKSNQFPLFLSPTSRKLLRTEQFIYFTLICAIYSLLLLWIQLSDKHYCPSCNARDFSSRASYERIQQSPMYDFGIIWQVSRYQCKQCPRSFNIYSNTWLANNKQHPSIVILQKFSFLDFSPLFVRFTTIKRSIPSINISIHKLSTAISSDVDNIATNIQFFLECLNEKQRRLFAGLISTIYSTSGIERTHKLTKLAHKTIRRGRNEILNRNPLALNSEPIRNKGAGRKSIINLYEPEILDFLKDETAGDPMTNKKWIRRSLRNIQGVLQNEVSIGTISKILKMNKFSLRFNLKSKAAHANHPLRNDQFEFIKFKKQEFLEKGIPVLSADGKKKELIGDFKKDGKAWRPKGNPYEVLDHEFANQAIGNLLPYGIYDIKRNHGYIVTGVSKGTTEFAVDAIALWCINIGNSIYHGVNEIYLLLDAGRPNSYRGMLFKYFIQTMIADQFGITVHISHYPPGTSKYNPIERKLFSFISINWEGRPLDSYETAINYMCSTKTQTGLVVDAILNEKEYKSGLSFTENEYATTNISHADICPQWNYIIRPRDKQITKQKLIEMEVKRISKDVWHFSNQTFKTEKKGVNEVHKFIKKSAWKYHKLDKIQVITKKKRKDGLKGRPPINCKMINEYYMNIKFTPSEGVNTKLE